MKNKKSIFIFFLSLMWHLKVFQFSLQRMYHMAEPHAQYIYILIDSWLQWSIKGFENQ